MYSVHRRWCIVYIGVVYSVHCRWCIVCTIEYTVPLCSVHSKSVSDKVLSLPQPHITTLEPHITTLALGDWSLAKCSVQWTVYSKMCTIQCAVCSGLCAVQWKLEGSKESVAQQSPLAQFGEKTHMSGGTAEFMELHCIL